jgi:hypothetical protein
METPSSKPQPEPFSPFLPEAEPYQLPGEGQYTGCVAALVFAGAAGVFVLGLAWLVCGWLFLWR